MSPILAALACALPQVPRWAGSPSYGCFGFRHGSDQCALYSLVLMGFALLGIVVSQPSLPISVRRWTLPKLLVFGLMWMVMSQPNLFA